jgi:hypothetical protein
MSATTKSTSVLDPTDSGVPINAPKPMLAAPHSLSAMNACGFFVVAAPRAGFGPDGVVRPPWLRRQHCGTGRRRAEHPHHQQSVLDATVTATSCA